jgi:hypothetical protein
MATNDELDARIAAQQKRFAERPAPQPDPCQHQWGTAYKSSSGRKVCVKCGFVTDPVVEREKAMIDSLVEMRRGR